MADLTDHEYQSLHGTFDTVNGDAWQEKDEQIPKRGEVPRIQFDLLDEPLPKNLDWREYGKLNWQLKSTSSKKHPSSENDNE